MNLTAPVRTSPDASISLLDEALRYHALGWSIIPLQHGGKLSPTGFSWRRFQRERPRKRDLGRWFGGDSPRNLAVVLGAVSDGLAVRDFDVEASYHEWAADHRELAQALPTSRTGRGYHVFFRSDGRDAGLPTKAVATFADGELRVRNCHVTLPPSRHKNGRRYQWLREPYHGVPSVYDVAAAGLIPAGFQTGFSRARARVLTPYHCIPLHHQETGASVALFGADGSLRGDAFDEVLGWTLPTGPGMRERSLWQLARMLKSIDETRGLRIDQLEPIIRRWWKLALPIVQTKEWPLTLGAFARAWERAWPMTEGGSMGDVLDRARRAGCPAELMEDFGNGVGGLVAAICRELARESTDGRFFLDCRTLARLCGLSLSTAAGYLRALIASRVIRRIGQPTKGKATEYVYLRQT